MSADFDDFWAWLDGSREVRRPKEARTRPEPLQVGYSITGSVYRKKPRQSLAREIRARQDDRCLYCEHRFGAAVRRKRQSGYRTVSLQLHWDHFVPFAFCQKNSTSNWVAACHVCNAIKGPRVFDTVESARIYILGRWAEKGYQLQTRLMRAVPLGGTE